MCDNLLYEDQETSASAPDIAIRRVKAFPTGHVGDTLISKFCFSLTKSREPTSAMAVNEPGLGSSADGKGEEGIDRSFDRAGTPKYLTE